MIGIPAELITICVLIAAIGVVGIAISGILWALTQIAAESKND
jgi:hypothetical protein|tara:strand:- start:3120 stop:3248 length:129 start_codon:yes stop_codon:yes gene_type:complete